ncbi:MAG: hypothetical protein KDI62_16860, partial [Anaerolineae bacterium]|nr:hypothetical protein [Anaerolineae bacterium]
QAANSYGIYYLHPLILYPLALIFVALPLSIYLKAFILVILTMLLSWVFTALVLKQLPLIRQIF